MQGQQKFKTRSKILPRKTAMQLLQHTGLFSSPFLLHLVTIQELLMVRQQSIGAKCGERYHFHFSWLLSLEVSSGSGTRCGAWWFSDTQGQGHSPLQRGSLGAYNLLVPSEIEQPASPVQTTLQQSPLPSGPCFSGSCFQAKWRNSLYSQCESVTIYSSPSHGQGCLVGVIFLHIAETDEISARK